MIHKPMIMQLPLEFLIIELTTFIIIGLLCLIIYIKTKEIYDLTKHKGIYYFRNTFLFITIAYFVRFLHLFIMKLMPYLDIRIAKQIFGGGFFISGFFSSLAILFLTSSLIWKKLPHKTWNILLVSIALLISVVGFLTRSPQIMIILQLLLILFSIIISYFKFKKIKKKSFFSQLHIIYVLLFFAWIISLLVFTRHLINPVIKSTLYIISMIIFGILTFKVHKRLSGHASKKR